MTKSLLTFGLLIAAIALIPVAAGAKGSIRVQKADGSVQTFQNVTFKVAGRTLQIETNDKAGTLILADGACSLGDNKILMCLPYSMSLKQNGTTRALDFHRGTVYYNKSDTKQTLTHSSTQLPPNGILGSLSSSHGTFVSFSGTLDSK